MNENIFLDKFDSAKSKFEKNLKDDLFNDEIEIFKKYNIIDDNNMFNYIYIHDIYQNMINEPLNYQINIISTDKEQLNNLFYDLIKDTSLNFNSNIIFQTYLNFSDIKNNNIKYNLYNNNQNLILQNKTLKEIQNYITEKKEEINNNLYLTESNNKLGKYPSIKFIFFYKEKYDNELYDIIKDNINKEYIKKNEKIKNIEQKILNSYFNDKNTLYLNDLINYRNTSILTTLNLFIFRKEDWNEFKESIIKKININEIKGYKDIIINNIIYNYKDKNLYFSDKEKENHLFNSNTNSIEENKHSLFKLIQKQIYTHFKNEMNFMKTLLINYNSLINDHMKISYDKSNLALNKDYIGDYLKNTIKSLVKAEHENYLDERTKKYENAIKDSKNEFINNLEKIKKEIDEKYFIRNNTFDYLQNEISNYLSNYKKEILDFLKYIDNLNIKLFYEFKKIINENGIYSINFDGLIKIIAVERLGMEEPINNIFEEHQNSLGYILTSLGISSFIGGTASFLVGRAATTIGVNTVSGSFGGPIGIGVGILMGFGSLFGQANYHYKKNRELINSLYDKLYKNCLDTINNVENSIQKEMDKINVSMEKDIQEVKKFINILIERVINILAE